MTSTMDRAAAAAESTADFYGLVHDVLEGMPKRERRGNNRREFACLQWVAPYGEGRLPTTADFIRVRCRDLSLTGFSFLAEQLPHSDYLLVALGTSPFTFVSAQVLHGRMIRVEGEKHLLIGCRFLRRISAPELSDALSFLQASY